VEPSNRQKLASTSPTSGGRSFGIVRSRTEATEFYNNNNNNNNNMYYPSMSKMTEKHHSQVSACPGARTRHFPDASPRGILGSCSAAEGNSNAHSPLSISLSLFRPTFESSPVSIPGGARMTGTSAITASPQEAQESPGNLTRSCLTGSSNCGVLSRVRAVMI
jgi:hypothetical protein